MGASAKATTNPPAIPAARVMMFLLLRSSALDKGRRTRPSELPCAHVRKLNHVAENRLNRLKAKTVVLELLINHPTLSGRLRSCSARVRSAIKKDATNKKDAPL